MSIKLSSTRVGAYLLCPLKYWFSYVERFPKKSNPSFKLGLACHESLELAGKIRMERELTDADVKTVLKKYDEVSISGGIQDMYIHKYGRKLIEKKVPTLNNENIIGVEYSFGFGDDKTTTDNGVPIIGAIDKVVEVDKSTLMIVDYKSSNTALTPDQLETDLQLSIYDYVSRRVWPGYERYILCLDYLKSEPIFTYRDEDSRKELEDYLAEVYSQMRSMKRENAEPRINHFCSWCDFKDNCKAYMDIVSKKDYVFSNVSTLSNEDLYKEWESVANTAKILSAREKELTIAIMEKVSENDETVGESGKEAYVRQNTNRSYDIEQLSRIIPIDDLLGMAKVSKTSIDKYISQHPEHRSLVDGTMSINYSRPFLAKRKSR